jgi:hypothetical protein
LPEYTFGVLIAWCRSSSTRVIQRQASRPCRNPTSSVIGRLALRYRTLALCETVVARPVAKRVALRRSSRRRRASADGVAEVGLDHDANTHANTQPQCVFACKYTTSARICVQIHNSSLYLRANTAELFFVFAMVFILRKYICKYVDQCTRFPPSRFAMCTS